MTDREGLSRAITLCRYLAADLLSKDQEDRQTRIEDRHRDFYNLGKTLNEEAQLDNQQPDDAAPEMLCARAAYRRSFDKPEDLSEAPELIGEEGSLTLTEIEECLTAGIWPWILRGRQTETLRYMMAGLRETARQKTAAVPLDKQPEPAPAPTCSCGECVWTATQWGGQWERKGSASAGKIHIDHEGGYYAIACPVCGDLLRAGGEFVRMVSVDAVLPFVLSEVDNGESLCGPCEDDYRTALTELSKKLVKGADSK